MPKFEFIAWQRADGRVGVGVKVPVGLTKDSFRILGTFKSRDAADKCAANATGARIPWAKLAKQ